MQLSGREPELTVDHLYEARRAIEISAAALAAQRVTPELTQTLESLLQAMADSAGDAAAYTAADVGFHVAVARATDNPLFPALLAPIATMIIKGMFESHGTPDAVRLGIEAHGKVLQAIRRGQPAAASRAMAAHLSRVPFDFPRAGDQDQPPRLTRPAVAGFGAIPRRARSAPSLRTVTMSQPIRWLDHLVAPCLLLSRTPDGRRSGEPALASAATASGEPPCAALASRGRSRSRARNCGHCRDGGASAAG